ncbi:DHA2 family efflux MFS transporter permease subunit [Pantoea sp. USHLN256]|uniref:DHA2 family efflux MFS transporter permease subunit n=1 Tax=Pantoea sp. USHLN256 TaxID=3081293 RepID=UPI003017BFBC
MTRPISHSPATLIRLQLGICLASFLGCIDFTIINTALPALQRHFGGDIEDVQWAMTLFVMALCCCMVMSARLAERFGARRVLYAGMLLFGIASLGAGLAFNLLALNIFRLLQGAGCAVLYTVSATILMEAMPAARRGSALGWLFAANGLGLALGPVAGGVLVSWLGWRAVFLLNVPLLALSFLFCCGSVAASKRCADTRLDIPGWLLMTAGLVPLLIWTSHVTRWGMLSLPSILTLTLSLLLLLAFVMVERRSLQPVIDFRMLRNSGFAAACLLSVLLAIFYCSAFMLMPFRLIAIFHLNDAQLGLMLLPVTLVMALISPLAGRLADRLTAWPVMAAGFALLTASALLQSISSSSLSHYMLALVLMGAGWGAILGPSVAAALSALPAARHAQGIGISWTLHNLGGALGLAIATQIYQTAATLGFQAVMWGLAGSALLGTLVAIKGGSRTMREVAE